MELQVYQFHQKNILLFLEFLILRKKLCRYDLYVGQGLFGMERRKIFDRSIELWRMCLEERTVEERYFILHYYDYFFREINLMNFFLTFKKGPGICHGVAGSGYVFLTLYR